MTAGIVTFHRAVNYGAVLQAYALSKAIENINHSAVIVDYLADCVLSRHKRLKPEWNVSSLYRYIKYRDTVNKRFDKFQLFLSQLPMTRGVKDRKELMLEASKLDAVICGSDQVWNTEITNNDFHFFLDFVPESTLKIAYAASFGNTCIPDEVREEIKRNLLSFDYISVREEAGAELVAELTGKRPAVTLDPTLLLNKEEWQSISKPINLPEHYILLYSVGEVEQLFPTAQTVSSVTGYPVVIFSHRKFNNFEKIKYLQDNGPEEFLYAFDKADYVITNSFHGTAFSVIFQKKFLTLPRTVKAGSGVGINSRVNTLLSHSHLETQLYTGGDPLMILENISYTPGREKLEEMKNRSYDFLKEALKEAK